MDATENWKLDSIRTFMVAAVYADKTNWIATQIYIFSVYAAENKYLCTVKHMPISLSCEAREEKPCDNVFFDTFFSKKTFCGMSCYITKSSISGNLWHCTFTGKERDEETGYGYFGARYMDHELMTMWLSVDPMADKYPNISPYAYCAWNPVRLVDPDGNEAWKPDGNGNLVAEKGDNAWTLATYLNTTPEIAINMLKEQRYSVDSKGVLNLKEGDVFKIDYGTTEALSNIELGKTGNSIRQQAGSGIAKDLFTNYWSGGGDITLTGSQFAGILMYIKESNQSPTESDSKSKLINFYNSQEYSLAYGKATVMIDSKQRIIGFNDTYNFDPKKLGQRTLINETKTRAVAVASNIMGNGKGFKVSYP